MEKLLEVQNLTKIYKKDRGVQDISFDIFKGDIFGFLGPNGAGKTTVMKVITGLIKPDRGSVKILGHNIADDFEKAMGKVGAVIETADSYEYMSAYKNLKLAARFYNDVKDERIDEVLELVGLEKYKKEKVGEFSLGMKQRLGLAAALLSKPEFIILDEPTNGLDIEGVVEIRNIVKMLAKEQGVSFFISSHVIHEMELTCSRVGIIYDGRLISQVTMEEVKAQNISLEDYFLKCVKESRGEVVNG
ncbi:MAG: ABC transporter ATP-binding protein [Bacillota bacterium]|nr:ABC transporter ATP-binding protein [Bacillota bacterium]